VPNRLAGSTSPYLQQHADNPVDWYEWGAEAFAAARERDVPILLSVGYSACHWCHVMAHESFEDPTTARLMNDRFVSVKVDREERPDVDAVYMDAVTAMTGHGGWPMTVFLDPDARPFYAGTYFPPHAGHGLPSFSDVLVAVSDVWRDRRADVVEQAESVVSRLERLRDDAQLSGPQPPAADELAAATQALARQYDWANGGFGGAPKFPPSMVCEFLLREHARSGDPDALLMAEATLRAMALGGMYDQLGGGFARYAVDAGWVVPHFEKMLYDNALLARVYAHYWRTTGKQLGRRIALETADFMVGELRTAQGGFAAALDADSDGSEGTFYVWAPEQLLEVLGPDDAAWAAEVFRVTEAGTFEAGSSTLQLRDEVTDPDRFAAVRRALRIAREDRIRPARDDKVVSAWNGLAIAALAEVGALFERPDLVSAAVDAARVLLDVHLVDGRLRRASRDGRPGSAAGVLEDYGDVAEGLISLYTVTGDAQWLQTATELLDVVLAQFADGAGAFFDTAHDAETLVRRPRDATDSATPSGQAAATGALLSAAALTGSDRYRDAVRDSLTATAGLAVNAPRFAGWTLAVAQAFLAGPVEVAVVGPDDELRAALRAAALQATTPGTVLAVGGPDSPVPLLAGRTVPHGRAAAYVCRQFVCQAPTSSVAELSEQLAVRPQRPPREPSTR
jgi:uncharacterized protein YyaL (SSP411 family)